MKAESTIEVSAVVTPNCAMASLSHTISYMMLQHPEMKKNTKNQPTMPPKAAQLDGDDTRRTTR
jgi:hypothetical protein